MRLLQDPMLRYRVMAWTVGVGLVVLVFVGIPLQIWADNLVIVKIVGTAHGYLYLVYLVAAFQLSRNRRWSLGKTLIVLLAGTVPLLSFVVERWVTRNDVVQPARQTVASEPAPR